MSEICPRVVITGASSGFGEGAVKAGFAAMLASDEAPDPQQVVDACVALAEGEPGARPVRTVVGITWGADELNALTQPLQDQILQQMQLEDVLGGADV